jgi:hypothetical protein
VFEICNPELFSQRFILKIVPDDPYYDFEQEFRFQNIFYDFGLAVEPIGHFKKNNGVK